MEPMLEICASPGDLPVVPASSQSAVDLVASHRLASFGGVLGACEPWVDVEAEPSILSTPSMSRVSWLSVPLCKR